MSSTAISAQGSILQVGSGSGSGLTISAISLGYPTIITCTAHGQPNGAVVALAGLTGANAGVLNGLSVPIRDVTTNTFSIDVNTLGLTITAAGTATPVTYTTINNLKTFNGFDGQASVLDVTNLSSSAKEIKLGIVDPGTIQLEMDLDTSDAGQAVLLAAYNGSLSKNFLLTLPNSHTATFVAFVRKFTAAGGVDQVVKRQCDLQITGPVTWA